MIKGIILLLIFTVLAYFMGKLVTKIQLPSILGWLLTGMILGPYALNWMNGSITDANWFHTLSNVGEILVGMMIGRELILKELKKSGKKIIIICLFEGLAAFTLVTIAFYLFGGVPISIALVIGAIALATAPAPSLSIVKEYKAEGPVSKTLIVLAALDDILALLIFFIVIGLVLGAMTGESINIISILMMIILPLALGAVTGFISTRILDKKCNKKGTILKVLLLTIATVIVGKYIKENIMEINLLLSGIAFSAVFVNKLDKERADEIMEAMNPLIGIALIMLVMNLGAPLNYKLIFGAGWLTVLYILARAIGKIAGTYIGGKISKAEKEVCNYLGLALLPHSGVSLIFTGIAVTTLAPLVPEYTAIIQGTIAAAAVINEIIAVFLAKQAFKMAGEISSNDKVEV